MREWDASSSSGQLYFSGRVHQPLPKPQAIENVDRLISRHKAATPNADPHAILWSDASRRGTICGIGTVCNVCLPGKPKYAIAEAEYIKPERSAGLLEAKALLMGLRRLKMEIHAARLAPGTPVAIIVVTDCQSNVMIMSQKEPLKPTTAAKYGAVLADIKAMSDFFLGLELDITLEIYWCPRNQTKQLQEADSIAGDAGLMKKYFYEKKCGTATVGIVRDCIKPDTRTEIVEGLGAALEEAAQRFLAKGEKHTHLTRRRKIPMDRVVEEEVSSSPESASHQHRKKRVRLEEPKDMLSEDKPQNNVLVAADSKDEPSDDA